MNVTVFNPQVGNIFVVSTDGASGGDTRKVYSYGDLGVSVEISSGNIPASGTIELFRKSDGFVVYSFTQATGNVENQTHTDLESLYQLVTAAVYGI